MDLTETLGHLLSSGLSLKDALAIALTIYRKGPVRRITSSLANRIEKGSSLFQALEESEMSFPPIYRGLVKIGEKIGSLENIFERLTIYLRERKQFREKGYEVTPMLLRGEPAEEILAASETLHPDLIALGAKGLTAEDSFVIGSVVQMVARFSRYSVLVGRAHEQQRSC